MDGWNTLSSWSMLVEGFSRRIFDVSVFGTIICTTLFGEVAKSEIKGVPTSYLPMIGLAAVAGMMLFIPSMFASFIVDVGFGLPGPSRGGRRIEFAHLNITERGNRIAGLAGLSGHVSFRVKRDVGIAYSLAFGRKVVVGEELLDEDRTSSDGLDAIIAHEVIHLTPGNYLVRAGRLVLYLAPFMALFYWERLLPEIALLPYLFAMIVYPMKMASHWSEYNADEGSARLVGPLNILRALMELRAVHGDSDSFTHPSFTKRIRRIREKFRLV